MPWHSNLNGYEEIKMVWKTKSKTLELAATVKSSKKNSFAIALNEENKSYDFITIQEGKEVDRRPLTDFGFKYSIVMNEKIEPDLVISLNGIEFFRVPDLLKNAYDGDIMTCNGARTFEEGVARFKEEAAVVLEDDDRITIVIPH